MPVIPTLAGAGWNSLVSQPSRIRDIQLQRETLPQKTVRCRTTEEDV